MKRASLRPRMTLVLVLAALAGPVLATDPKPSTETMADPQHLKPCPTSPNCVSSEARETSQRVEAFELVENTPESWQAVIGVVREQPRTDIVAEEATRMSAEVSSRVFGFVDDLDLVYHPETGRIGVRSASRSGYWDMGANRSRVEDLRAALLARDLVR